MGVPVVTLCGHCHAHNVGKSLLHIIGIADEWSNATQDEYVACAVRWAAVHDRLASLRTKLRAIMLSSPLCDAATFLKVCSLHNL
jgi:predicted O-linked N-acetylglucosamine transferase (SPINDLY family)